jgi:hypothetical protein
MFLSVLLLLSFFFSATGCILGVVDVDEEVDVSSSVAVVTGSTITEGFDFGAEVLFLLALTVGADGDDEDEVAVDVSAVASLEEELMQRPSPPPPRMWPTGVCCS